MSDAIGTALHVLFVALGLSASTTAEPTLLTFALVAAAALAVAVVALHAVALPTISGRSAAHPLRSIDASAPLAQSDPDAAGHSRPRAPGLAASAA